MRPPASLFLKILSWFFLNLVIVSAALGLFFALEPQVNLRTVFGQEGIDRLRAAGMLISHDMSREPKKAWPGILKRHAEIHNIDFALILEDRSVISSTGETSLPENVMELAQKFSKPHPPPGPGHHPSGNPPPSGFGPPPEPGEMPRSPDRMPHRPGASGNVQNPRPEGSSARVSQPPQKPPHRPMMPPGKMEPDVMSPLIRTKNPTRYWSGIRLPIPPGPNGQPIRGVLFAVSDSATGNGFFFDPLPWMLVAGAILVISVLFWTPMVRHITRPLTRITLATEAIAKGRFDVSIHEPRTDEIGRLATAVNHMTSRLSAFVTGQKRFLGDVAHELGSPIARIRFGLATLENRLTESDRERLEDVMEDVAHMSDLVNELLAFTRAEINAGSVTLESVNLLGVAREAVRRESPPQGNGIEVHVPPDIQVMASPELLIRALSNLIRNAVHYAAGNGPIRITAKKKNGDVAIEVQDTGPGVPEELLGQLFEPFFRPEPSRSRDSGGVGLGLAIVRTCVETCQGSVSARNLEPQGFSITIHLAKA